MKNAPRFAHFRPAHRMLLSQFLSVSAGLSRLRIEKLLSFGAIYVNGVRTRQDCEVDREDDLRVHFQPKPYPVPETIDVIYEDDDFLAIDKPSGLPTHPTLDNYVENASYQMQLRLQRKLWVTHRLDIGTEGVLILAKTSEAQVAFNRLLADRKIQKIYRAITEKPIPIGRYEHHMEIDGPTPKRVFAQPTPQSCHAILNVTKSWELNEGFACEVSLETGRTHQIRAQLSFLGGPILGDVLYGSTRTTQKFVHERLALECYCLSFTHRSRTIGIYRPTPLVAPLSTKDS